MEAVKKLLKCALLAAAFLSAMPTAWQLLPMRQNSGMSSLL